MWCKAVPAALHAAEHTKMSPWNLWVNKSIAPKHLSQLQQLLETSFWNQIPLQEPGPGCECRKAHDTAQQRAKRQEKKRGVCENPCNASILMAQNWKECRMAKKKKKWQRWPKEIQWRSAAKHKPLTPQGGTETSTFCFFEKTGGGKSKAGRKMSHQTWRRSVHELRFPFQRPLCWAKHSGKQDSPLTTSCFQQNAAGNLPQLAGRNRNSLTRSRSVFGPEMATASR